jgi:SAM-dependent methyltransferase
VSSTHPESDYVFNNARSEAAARFGALATLYDPVSIRHLERYVAEGSHCLEVGAGSGSLARWMSGRVGTTGSVVATDLDTRFLSELAAPNLEVRQHNIVSDPLEEAAFDVVHTRLVLVHLPERRQVLQRMIGALKPGGWLVLQEFEATSLLADAAAFEGEYLFKSFVAMQGLMAARGVDTQFGRRLLPLALSAGLEEASAEGHVMFQNGGSAGSELLRANFGQLHDALISSGRLSEAELAEDMARLDDPAIFWPSQILWTVCGRKP